MKKNTKKIPLIALSMLLTTVLTFTSYYIAIKYCIQNAALFAVMMLILPIIIISAAAFAVGFQIRWNWKKGLCIALTLTLLSLISGYAATAVSGNNLSDISSETIADNHQTTDDELMDDLYDELDRKAYDYMLEQGLISEGEEIYSEGEKTTPGSEQPDSSSDTEELYSEMYVGIQKSDPVTEFISNLLTLLIAFGASFAGGKMHIRQTSEKYS